MRGILARPMLFAWSLALAVALVLGFASSARAANLAPNPGFETACPPAPCNWFGVNATLLDYPIAPHVGASSNRVIATGTSTIVSALSDCFPVTAGTTYNLQAWYLASPPVTISQVGYGATYFAGAGCTGASTSPAGASATPPVINSQWHSISAQQIAPNGAPFVALSARLQLNFSCVLATCETSAGSGLLDAVQWDDVVFDSSPLAVPPPTIAKAFSPTTINVNDTSALTFTINNTALGNGALTGVAFSDTLPAGVVVATPNGQTGTCGGGTITATAGSGSVSLSGASLAAGASCTFSVDVIGNTAGSKVNTTGNITSTESGQGGTATATLTVNAPTPVLTKAFNPTSIQAGGTTVLTFTVTNPAGAGAVANVAFTDTLPANLRVANATVGGTCANAAAATTVAAGGTSVVVANLQVPAGASSCTVTVNITNATGQTGTCPAAGFTNAAANITSSANVVNSVQPSCVTVTAALQPSLDKAFSPTSIQAGGTTVLTFTVTNPAGAGAVANVAFTDTLPANLRVANATVGGTCANAAAATTVAAGGTSVVVANLQVPAGASSCTVTVNITNATGQTGTCPAAGFTNAAANITSSANVTNAVTSTCLTVTTPAQVPSLTKALSPGTITAGGTSTLTFTITNPATNNPAQTFSFIDTLPSGMQVAGVPAVVNGCGGTVTATAGAGSITVAGSSVGASTATPTTCPIAVNVTNAGGQTNASCAGNPAAFTNSAANISGATNISATAVTPSCLVVNSVANTFSITKVPSVTSATPGSPLSYTIAVTNNGPGAANGAVLTDPAIAGFAATGIACTNATSGAVCPAGGTLTVPNLQAGGIALPTFPANSTITFVLSGTFVQSSGSTVNVATITSAAGVTPVATASGAATVNVAVVGPAATIPTLGEYALIALMALLALVGARYARRARR